MSRRLAAAVLPLTFLLACRGTPAPVSPSRPSSTSAHTNSALDRRVLDRLADPAIAAGTWAVEVRSLATGEMLVASNAHRLLTPASTMKTITLAVAAEQLGWDYTYETRLIARGSIAGGTLTGDLVIVGAGDPSLDDWDGAASGVFGAWAARLKELGISRVNGRIVGDDRAFSDDGLGPGWAWDDLEFAYSAPASALQFNDGAAQLIVMPAAAAGTPATLTVRPSYAEVPLVGSVSTGPAGSTDSVTVLPLPHDRTLAVGGTVPAGGTRVVRNIAVPNATVYFAAAVKTALEANGIIVSGPAVDVDDLGDTAVAAGPETAVATHRSPQLPTLADTLMKLSQNMYAETLLRTLGREGAGAGTADAGRTVVRDVLAGWSIPASEATIADGSGLSRYNLITADALVSVLAHVYGDDRLRAPYVASLPVAGRSGTLAARMKGTAAEGVVQAKTGSFTNARSVAGFARSADGEPLAFAIIANNYGVAPDVADRVTDAIMVSLAEFRR